MNKSLLELFGLKNQLSCSDKLASLQIFKQVFHNAKERSDADQNFVDEGRSDETLRNLGYSDQDTKFKSKMLHGFEEGDSAGSNYPRPY